MVNRRTSGSEAASPESPRPRRTHEQLLAEAHVVEGLDGLMVVGLDYAIVGLDTG
jgi:hypothetical protein